MDKYIYIIIYVTILIFGLINYKKYSHNKVLRFWLYFIIYSLITEITASFLIHVFKIKANALYNTWFLGNSLFYILFFWSQILSFRRKIFVIAYAILFILYTVINIVFFKDYIDNILRVNFIVGQFFVVITIMLYYAELLNSNKILVLNKSLFFWVSIGTLIFNIGLLPVFVIVELIKWQGVFKYIILSLNLIMASCFIAGFIVSKKEFNI